MLAAVTCTFGNLAAYGQTNIKRLLAYSTIAHAGYMMMPVAAAVALAGSDPDRRRRGDRRASASTSAIYLFMNLGAFAIVAFLRNAMRSEEIADYAGLITPLARRRDLLLDDPVQPGRPAAAGRLLRQVAAPSRALADAEMWTLLVIGGLNTAISLFYYLRVVKIMTIDPEPENRLPVNFSLDFARRRVRGADHVAGRDARHLVGPAQSLGAEGRRKSAVTRSQSRRPTAMTPTVALLNRLLTIHCRSLPMYLDQIDAWATGAYSDRRRGREGVPRDRARARKIRRDGSPSSSSITTARFDVGPYPMEFTDKNDLSLDYLVREAIDDANAAGRSDPACSRRLADERRGGPRTGPRIVSAPRRPIRSARSALGPASGVRVSGPLSVAVRDQRCEVSATEH